ncbi:MAG: serine hydrolase [Bacteroidetes bacterium]|nr:serine hydrolase [Bacteroidota bacterium]
MIEVFLKRINLLKLYDIFLGQIGFFEHKQENKIMKLIRITSWTLLVATLCIAQVNSIYDGPKPEMVKGLESRIDSLVAPYVKAGMFNGVILVAEGNQIMLQKAYGNANYELGVANQPSTKFRIASLSKQFTNAAIGILIDKGIINPDSRLSEFLPNFPRAGEITVRQLIEHRSGVPHTNTFEELKHVTHLSLPQMIELLASKHLDFDPGSNERYSNGGYDLLAAIIEKASGQDFESFLSEYVFIPLGLQNTGRLHTYKVIQGLADGYLPGIIPGGHTKARFYPSEIRIGGGSLYSTAKDVYRLFRATFQREFASKKSGDLLFWDQTKKYEITGRAPGFVAKVFIDIPQDITIVSLANNYSFLVNWGRRLYQAAINDPWKTTSINWVKDTSLPDTTMQYTGIFESRWDRGFIEWGKNGNLLYEDKENDWRVAMIPLTKGYFLHPFFDSICRFSGNGIVDSLICRPVLKRINEETVFLRVKE